LIDARLSASVAGDVARALAEDIGSGDVTANLVPPDQWAEGQVVSREAAILCGRAWFDEVFHQLEPRVTVSWKHQDGDSVAAGATLCEIAGPARAILSGERCALNFLQTLSGTASAARRYADAVRHTACRILDTRKTLPGLRLAQKYAVRCGGADNHRLGLYDMVLIKENHIVAAGSIEAAIASARRGAPGIKVEVEVESVAEFARALAAQPDIIMLDELSDADMRECVRLNAAAAKPAKLEASGSVSLERVATIAATGVDFISVGSITKHLQAVDLSMRLKFARAA
jgi:nicotinate-nucleotide pyrophosphorylase (carboxylating)